MEGYFTNLLFILAPYSRILVLVANRRTPPFSLFSSSTFILLLLSISYSYFIVFLLLNRIECSSAYSVFCFPKENIGPPYFFCSRHNYFDLCRVSLNYISGFKILKLFFDGPYICLLVVFYIFLCLSAYLSISSILILSERFIL